MGRIHFLTQFIWPDDAPTGIYLEQVAQKLHEEGHDTVVVGGEGSYRRETQRPEPSVPRRQVAHYAGSRHSLISKMREYRSVHGAFVDYVRREVKHGDVVVVTTAPPGSLTLHARVHRQGARGIYWMQDYYPELARAVFRYPRVLEGPLVWRWKHHLSAWDHVVKIGRNLGYEGTNVSVIRNWPTLDLGPEQPFEKGMVLYAGNLGHAHDLPLLLAACERLRVEGRRIVFRADGSKVKHLPSWIERQPLLADRGKLIGGFWQAETHLVAANPRYPNAVFPSKYWNCRATGREIVCTGFTGAMLDELGIAAACDYTRHLRAWVELVKRFQ